MKTLSASLKLKEKLRQGRPVFGCRVTLESPTITEIATRMGFDFILVDAEHGHMESKEIMEHFHIANLMATTCAHMALPTTFSRELLKMLPYGLHRNFS